MKIILKFVCCSILVAAITAVNCFAEKKSTATVSKTKGSASSPLRVMMVPADTGGADVTEDFKPLFDAITKQYGIHFNIVSGSSYSSVVKGLCAEQADIAWFGPVTYGEARKLCGAELLAVDVKNGVSEYYAGIFVRRKGSLKKLDDIKGKSLALGSPLSTSSFNVPLVMLIEAGIDPSKDLGKVFITGGHTNSIAALREGRIDAAAASTTSWEKAVRQGIVDPAEFKALVISDGIPNPPLAIHPGLSPQLKSALRNAFSNIHKKVPATLVRGYGGKMVDRYNVSFSEDSMLNALQKLSVVTNEIKEELLEKAAER